MPNPADHRAIVVTSGQQDADNHEVTSYQDNEPSYLFGVRCRMGRVMGIVFTSSLVTCCFVIYVLRCPVRLVQKSSTAEGVAFGVIVTVLFLLTMSSFLLAALRHPGRVPLFFHEEALNRRCAAAFENVCNRLHIPDAKRRELRGPLRVGVTAVALVPSLRYCEMCRVYKVSTTHHCSACGVCVFEMDHHCPWLGVCVARDSHKFFLLFLGYVVVACAAVVATGASTALSSDGVTDATLFGVWLVCCVFGVLLAPFAISSTQTVQQNSSTIARLALMRAVRSGGRSGVSGSGGLLSPPVRSAHGTTYVPVPPSAANTGSEQESATPSTYLSGGGLAASPGRVPPPTGLARIMGTDRPFPWWILPTIPRLLDPEDNWTEQLEAEIEEAIAVQEHLKLLAQREAGRT